MDSIINGDLRYRTRVETPSQTRPFEFRRDWFNGSSDSQTMTFESRQNVLRETMTDRPGSVLVDGAGKMRRFVDTNCQHDTMRLMAPPGYWKCLPVEFVMPIAGYHAFVIPHEEAWWPIDLEDLSPLVPLPPEELLLQTYRRALNKMSRQMPLEAGFNELIQDVTQVKELIPSLRESVSNTIAGGYLSWSFGIAPFAADLVTVTELVSRVQKRLDWLVATWGKKTKLSYRQLDYWEPPAIPWETDFGTWPYVGVARRTSYKAMATVGCWLTHHLRDLLSLVTKLRGVGYALGFNNPLRAAWQSMPFSFVMDWLLGVDDVLDEQGFNQFLDGDWLITRPCLAVSVKSTLGVRQYTRYLQGVGWHADTNTHQVTVQRYRRWTGFPNLPVYELSMLDPSAASLLLAILRGTSPV